MIKIVPSGDYVQLKYVDTLGEYVQEELKSDADAIEYSSDSSGKIYLKFGRMTFDYFDPTEFEIDGSAVTDAADFITKLTALFSGGGGSGIDSVLAIGEPLTANRDIDVGEWELSIQSNHGGDPTMEVAHSQGEWYASFVNGADQCTLHVNATAATVDDGTGGKKIATETTANGTFTTVDLKTVTVVNGIITAITD